MNPSINDREGRCGCHCVIAYFSIHTGQYECQKDYKRRDEGDICPHEKVIIKITDTEHCGKMCFTYCQHYRDLTKRYFETEELIEKYQIDRIQKNCRDRCPRPTEYRFTICHECGNDKHIMRKGGMAYCYSCGRVWNTMEKHYNARNYRRMW